jgi:hypothetical protein
MGGDSARNMLACDAASSTRKGAERLKEEELRLLVVIPAVAKEGTRLAENLREWARDRYYPCGSSGGRRQPQTDLMLLFSRTPAETPAWLQGPGGAGGGIGGSAAAADQALADLVGEAAGDCFGRVSVRYANLTAEEEQYQGVRTGIHPYHIIQPACMSLCTREREPEAEIAQLSRVPRL